MSIGNCPRCGGQNDDENEYCLDCRMREAFEVQELIDDDTFIDSEVFDGLGLCDTCGDRYTSPGSRICWQCQQQNDIDAWG